MTQKLAFYPLAIEQRLRRRRVRLCLHRTTLDPLEVERFRRLLAVEQVLHHEEIRLCQYGPRFQIAYFDCVKAEQLREYGRSARGRLHMQEIGGRQLDEHLPFRRDVVRQSVPRRKKKNAQVGDVPGVDQRLDDEPIVRRLPKVRAALPPLSLPRLALGHAPRKRVLRHAAPSPERVELPGVVHRAAEPEPSPDRPLVLDVRTLVDRQRVGVQQAVVPVRRGRRGPRRDVALEHVPHGIR